MKRFVSIMDITSKEWLEAMDLARSDVPDILIVEGSWWRAQRRTWRLGYLKDVRELGIPDVYWGRWRESKVAYTCAYGAPRTSEIVHIFGSVGTPLAVQIGTCGGLHSDLQPGDIVLPAEALAQEGLARHYGAGEIVRAWPDWNDRAERHLSTRALAIHRGKHVTWMAIFTETADLIASWQQAGCLSVDMETATTFAVARHFGMSAVSLLAVWDDLTRGRSFLDPLGEQEQQALHIANTSVYEVALELSEEL